MDNTAGKAGKGMSAIRLDLPHAKANYHHWNVNSLLSRAKDPHASASSLGVYAGKSVNNAALFLQKVGPALAVTTAVIDGVRIGSAAYEDYKARSSVPENTVKTVAHVAGGYAGGYTGALAGGAFGAKTGGIVGTAFGPVGSLTGAAVGGVAGSVAGAIGGAIGGAELAERASDEALKLAMDEGRRQELKETAEMALETVQGLSMAAGSVAAEAAIDAASWAVDVANDPAVREADTAQQALSTAQETAETVAGLAKDAGLSAAECAVKMTNTGAQWMASTISNLKSKL
ncbi:Protein C13G5.2 [Aphelenchoides avenae]|nr:Protein C13G5.2 [Aphelenchus avenae]